MAGGILFWSGYMGDPIVLDPYWVPDFWKLSLDKQLYLEG